MYALKLYSYKDPKYIRYIATMSGGGPITGNSALAKAFRAQNTITNASNLEIGQKILASRTNTAVQAQALANQTGGNILGFTYE